MTGINEKINALSSPSGDDLRFSVVEYSNVKSHAVLRIECDFDKIEQDVYLRELALVEKLIMEEGVRSISYRIINKSETATKPYRKLSLPSIPYLPKEEKKALVEKSLASFSESKKAAKKLNIAKGLKGYGLISGIFVKLRTKPTIRSAIKTYLFKGAVVLIRKKSKLRYNISYYKDFWYNVETKDKKRGWVFGRYLGKTNIKVLSSYLHNNYIYKDFLKKSKLLLRKDIRKSMAKKAYKIDILYDIFHVNIVPSMKVAIPFSIIEQAVRWKLNKISIKGVGYIGSAPKIKDYDKNDALIPLYLEGSKLSTEKGITAKKGTRYSKKPSYKAKQGRIILKDYNLYSDGYDKTRKLEKPKQKDKKDKKDKIKKKSIDIDKLLGKLLKQIKSSKAKGGYKDSLKANTLFSSKAENKVESIAHIQSVPDYNVQIEISEYLKRKLIFGDYKLASSILEIVKAKLLARDYPKKNIRFHGGFNQFYDTIKLSLDNIDFDDKIASFSVERISPNFRSGPSSIKDKIELDFKRIDDKHKKIDYDKFGELYYSDIIFALREVGSYNRKELIGLASSIVSLLVKQRYV